MNILHYALGFPPYRTGGMTKYCLDLMEEQLRCGHQVAMLWPGKIKKYGYNIQIKKRKSEKIGKGFNCMSYEIINPLPVPLLDGIRDVDAFIQSKEGSVFNCFFKENNIQVLHIHTLMGLPKECIDEAKKLNIRVIYTTHDYFGLCPKWGLLYNGKVCEDDDSCKKCIECNKTALSLSKIKILQSSLYKSIKRTKIVSILRRKHNKDLYKESKGNIYPIAINNCEEVKRLSEQYVKLRNFYITLLRQVDVMHFNSSNTKKIFERYFSMGESSRVISLSHSSILDNRKKRDYEGVVSLGYLGPITEHKGFYALKEVCDELYNEYKNKFKLHIFNNYEGEDIYMVKHKSYTYDELPNIMNSIDILIVPSLWNETFGFTVLEALSYGVPVIVSNRVGAKDLLINKKSGIIYNDIEDLKICLKNIIENPKEVLSDMNKYIVSNLQIKDIKRHSEEIIELYGNY